MLDSLARVSRRGGWTTDRTRRPRERPAARCQADDPAARNTRLSTESQRRRPDPPRQRDDTRPPRPSARSGDGREYTRSRARRGGPCLHPCLRPPATQPAAASYPGGSASSPSDANGSGGDQSVIGPVRSRPNPWPSLNATAAPAGGLTPPVALRGSTRFSPERFHALLNSLSKVLFNFPSRYLFAIGLVVVFSLRWSLPPA